MGEVLTPEFQADELAFWAATAPLTEGVLTPFGVIDPARLSQDGAINAALSMQRLINWANAQLVRILAEAASRPEPVPAPQAKRAEDRQRYALLSLEQEIACALRWSPNTAAGRFSTATTMTSKLGDTLDLLEAGDIEYAHARALADAVERLDDPHGVLAAKLQKRVLAKASQRTAAEFRRDVRRGVAVLDPRTAQEKHAASAEDRAVSYHPDENAMAWLRMFLPAVDAQTIMIAIQAVADAMKKADPNDARTADQLRADALSAICVAVLNGQPIDGLGPLPKWQGRRPNVNVAVALSTLLGLDEQPGDLDGYGPIPPDVARRIAADPSGTWHRILTDDLGRLIDYGQTKYRPPQDLIDHVTARDRTCRGMGCHRSSRRSDLDHETDFAQGGHTSAENLEPECGRDHALKHQCGWTVTVHPDRTIHWTSPSGRRYEKPPDLYPVDRTRPKTAPEHDDDPPPF